MQVLRAMLGIQVTEEQLQSIVERAIQEADLDQDDAISFDEFRKVKAGAATFLPVNHQAAPPAILPAVGALVEAPDSHLVSCSCGSRWLKSTSTTR